MNARGTVVEDEIDRLHVEDSREDLVLKLQILRGATRIAVRLRSCSRSVKHEQVVGGNVNVRDVQGHEQGVEQL